MRPAVDSLTGRTPSWRRVPGSVGERKLPEKQPFDPRHRPPGQVYAVAPLREVAFPNRN